MGVAGSGKTTIGSLLSERLGCAFADSDDFHTRENKAKMSSGVPLTDADRMPWLQAIQRYVAERAAAGEKAVVACSALKASYRTMLDQAAPGKVAFVYLNISPELTEGQHVGKSICHLGGTARGRSDNSRCIQDPAGDCRPDYGRTFEKLMNSGFPCVGPANIGYIM
jgi:hypothetical protein